jgi:hypothetical protein
VLDELFQRSVPFVATVGIAVGDAGDGSGRAHLANHDAVRNRVGTMHAAAAFADVLIARRNVSVTVRLDDADGQAVRRAAFHWVVTP